jgi:hypothetical protein
VDVTGTISMNGSPVEGANVIFHPLDGAANALASQATTDADGRFELQTHTGAGKYKPGIVRGKYAVAVTKLDTAAIASTLAPPRSVLPKKYSNPATSGLSADVGAGAENDFPFSLEQK